jgi:hypothetical protein
VGTATLGQDSSSYTLHLQQTGSKVVGDVVIPRRSDFSGQLEGTVTGNQLSFRNTTGRGGAEITVTGNAMTGQTTGLGSRLLLQRQQ